MSNMKPIYFNKEGQKIDKASWVKLQADRSYCFIHEYDNARVYVAAKWRGEIPANLIDTYREYWPLYELVVGNYNAAGNLVPDPVENGKTYPTEGAVALAYENFLERWTASNRNDEGEFVEEDNNLTPPPPPNPDAPATSGSCVKIGDDDVGAW